MEPLVSVLIPTNNRPQLLLKAVKSALAQTYKNIEIVITDNSSERILEDDINHISDDRIFYKKNNINIGPILNWRKALGLSRGKYCILLPDDDFFINPFYIEDVVNIAEENKIDLVITNCILGYPGRSVVGNSGHVGLITGKTFINGFWKEYSVPTIANLFNRSKALQLDAFNSNYILYSDIELWLKMMIEGKSIYCYPFPSVYYLFHDNNIVTTMTKDALIENSRFIKSALGAAATEDSVRTLANRYVHFLDNISNVVSISFVRSVYKESNLKNGEYFLLSKVLLLRYFQRLKVAVRKLINRFLK